MQAVVQFAVGNYGLSQFIFSLLRYQYNSTTYKCEELMFSLFCKAPRLLPRTAIMLSSLLSYVARMYPFAYPTVLNNMIVLEIRRNNSASAEEIIDSFYLDENY